MRAPQIPSAPHRSSESRFGRKRKRRRITLIVASVVAIVLAGTAAFAIANYNDLSNGIHRSLITLPSASSAPLPGVTQNTGATNILVMGLDSRLDENGNRLPANVYNALHAGNQSDGGYNTNVLMLIHIPAGGGKAVGISIPRDDYATLAGSPDGVSASKIKEAYGLALDAKLRKLVNAGGMTYAEAYQQARAAARQAEIATVSNFLGGVTINHFIEVTMAAFYEVATAVQPITVCLNEATSDAYSGASFPAGIQKLTASQAVSFVRQRRDTSNPKLDFTDLDRERRQQAFIVSLAYKLKQANTFTNFGTMQSLIDTAKQNIALDTNFNLLSFAGQAARLAGGNISFVTLPIIGFGVKDHKDVNLVDLTQIHALVSQLLLDSPPPTPTPSPTGKAGGTKPSTPIPVPTASNVYNDYKTPLQGGAIPCVK